MYEIQAKGLRAKRKMWKIRGLGIDPSCFIHPLSMEMLRGPLKMNENQDLSTTEGTTALRPGCERIQPPLLRVLLHPSMLHTHTLTHEVLKWLSGSEPEARRARKSGRRRGKQTGNVEVSTAGVNVGYNGREVCKNKASVHILWSQI